ncbi:sensor histidine kinase [Bradyrhizobium stylosanthis]|uniref:histidine kinase n=1 Tax=Bradyrhizobium stylosanthis TaxID=1803665 RepID=A0A560DFP7_9BRAD|nr:PAS domain-containing sensor histidine kinase [Bradyrhizobium stylosanthis]TWA95921.1 PAS domain S-box-containing protein [Bradyrhizobium stylosanthis]
MPWVDKLTDPQELRRCIRDLVALSTLPAIWKDYNSRQIADSAAAALLSMLHADVIYVTVPGLRDEAAADVMRTSQAVSIGSSGHIERILRGASRGRHEQIFAIDNPLGEGTLRILATPMGFGGDAGIVAGSVNPQFPGETDRLLLGIAANHATLAIQRWHAEAELRRLAAVIERSSEFIGFADLDGTPQYLNKAAYELLGLSDLEEVQRLSIFDFIAPHERTRALHEALPMVMGTGRWLGELHLRHFRTGEIIPFLVDWFRIDDKRTGHPTNMASVSRDLRPQKKLESDLRSLNESLEQRVKERTSELAEALERLTIEAEERARADIRAQKLQEELHHASRLSAAGQMAGALAHELNQPLTALTNLVNAGRRMMANGAPYRVETVRDVLGEAAEQGLRAGEIIRRLREFVTRGETEMRIENLPELIREASNLASAGTGPHGVQVRLNFDPRAEAVFASRIQLQQVILNLIRNAHEAMAQSEWRELEVVTARLDDKSIEIAVADRGSGLPDDIVEHLFEPFHTTKVDGMGLGLSICRSIVEAHRGKLAYEPNCGGGAIFRVTLPVPLEQ